MGRSDITMETSSLVSMMASSCEGHLKEVFHMLAFLKGKHNSLVVFDPNKTEIYLYKFPREDSLATAYGKI